MVGCGAGSAALAPVKGKVAFKGSPLTSGTVVFIPETAPGTLAIAEIQPDGTFTLRTGDNLGAVLGHHRVTIACLRAPPNTLTSAAPGPGLPQKYRDPHLSGLVGDVRPNTTNVINFELE
jgi:hypothetical protein